MYRVRSTGEVKSQGEVRSFYPNTSFPKTWTPELVESLGLDPVFETPAPTVTRYQVAYKNGVEQVNGKWQWKWAVSEMSDEAKTAKDAEQAKSVRSTRDKMLSDSDWTQLADSPGSARAAYVQYRQSLRDVPSQPGFPWDVTWPTKP